MSNTLLRSIKKDTIRCLGSNLKGIYLHGSYALGGYNPKISDLDFVIVTKKSLTSSEKRQLMACLLNNWLVLAPAKGLEFHVVTLSSLRTINSAPTFDFHFSQSYLEEYLASPDTYVEMMKGTDPDLVAHYKIIQKKGKNLYGPKAKKIFPYVSNELYWQGICYDLQDAEELIIREPIYMILNLCRGLAFYRNRQILSKQSGGRWALTQVPKSFQPLIESALLAYRNGGTMDKLEGDAEQFHAFAEYMLAKMKINKQQ